MRLAPDADSFRCDYCHNIYLPEKGDDGVRVLGEPSSELCPNCNLSLVQAAITGIRILYCTKCHGMLVSMEIFANLIVELRSLEIDAAIQPSAQKSGLARRVDCPRCHKQMDSHYYAGPGNVVIDSCETCSLNWLERGELMHIVRAPDRGPQEPIFETALGDDDTTGTAR